MNRFTVRKNLHRAKARALLGGKCMQCSETDKLHFDHIDPETKSFNIATHLDYSWPRLLAEVIKCQLLCPSHHGIKTARENGKPGLSHGRVSMYTIGGCRCDLCREAQRVYNRKYSLSLRTV